VVNLLLDLFPHEIWYEEIGLVENVAGNGAKDSAEQE
jgi:hypothetical protein